MARMRQAQNSFRTLAVNREREKRFGRPGRRWHGIIATYLN
jgi:hypothetical protein